MNNLNNYLNDKIKLFLSQQTRPDVKNPIVIGIPVYNIGYPIPR